MFLAGLAKVHKLVLKSCCIHRMDQRKQIERGFTWIVLRILRCFNIFSVILRLGNKRQPISEIEVTRPKFEPQTGALISKTRA